MYVIKRTELNIIVEISSHFFLLESVNVRLFEWEMHILALT